MNIIVQRKVTLLLLILSLCLAGCGGELEESKEKAAEKKELVITTKEEEPEVVQPEKEPAAIQPEVEKLAGQLSGGGSWAVYVYGLDSQQTAAVNSRPMQSASLIKLFIAGAVYEQKAAVEAQDTTAGETDSLLERMITVSDNEAANTLIKRLGNGDEPAGLEVVNQFAAAGGYGDTHMGRLMLDFEALDDNYTSVEDCGKLLREIYTQNMTGAANLLELMKKQERTGKLPSGIPSGTVTANKTGELETVENDAAIVWGEKEPYVICVMSEGLSDTAAARESMKTLSENVYRLMKEADSP